MNEKKIDEYLQRFHRLEQVKVKINERLIALKKKIREEVANEYK